MELIEKPKYEYLLLAIDDEITSINMVNNAIERHKDDFFQVQQYKELKEQYIQQLLELLKEVFDNFNIRIFNNHIQLRYQRDFMENSNQIESLLALIEQANKSIDFHLLADVPDENSIGNYECLRLQYINELLEILQAMNIPLKILA